MWLTGKESTWQCRRHERGGFSFWVEKILWRRKWQPTLVFLHGKSHAWRATVHGVAKSQTWLSTRMHAHTHTHTCILVILWEINSETCFTWFLRESLMIWHPVGHGDNLPIKTLLEGLPFLCFAFSTLFHVLITILSQINTLQPHHVSWCTFGETLI